jgi:ApaG protein
MGRMVGTYQMVNQNNQKQFEVNIPPFELIVPAKFN